MKVVDIVGWLLNAIILILMIKAILLRIKTKKIFKEIEKITQARDNAYEEFVEEYNKRMDNISEVNNTNIERLNLLSKENNKLRDENEELKERLRSLGITYFD